MKKQKFKQTEIGMIPENWDVKSLGEVITFQRGHDLPVDKFEKGQFPVIKSNGLAGYHSKFKAKGPGVLLGRSGKIGEPMFIDKDYWPHNTTLFSKKFHNSHPKFVYYFLRTLRLQNYNAGSAVPTLNRNHIHPILIAVPLLGEQSAISKILSDLDAKIEINQQMNKTLETIGQAIFKRWFVDANSTNNTLEELGSFIEFIKGKKPKDTSNLEIKGYKKQILIENLNGENSLYANPVNTVEVNIYDPIMVMDGASSGRIEIGHEGVLGSTLAKIIPNNARLSGFFIYYFLKSNESNINANTTGTSIPHTDKGKIRQLLLEMPSEEKLREFNKLAKSIFDKIISNKTGTKIISNIRDSLLPKLMSGKIRVPMEVKK